MRRLVIGLYKGQGFVETLDIIFKASGGVTRPFIGAKVFARKDGTCYTMGKKGVLG